MDNKAIALEWVKSLPTEKERKDFEKVLRNSLLVLNRLYEILDERQRNLDNQEINPKDFDTPNWPYKQAYRSGQKSVLKDLKDLFNFL